MTAQGSDPAGSPPAKASAEPDAIEERPRFSYQGSKVPLFIVLVWTAFFVWGVVYMIRWVPESWREWFSR